MKSSEKALLSVRTKEGTTVKITPLAVFNGEQDARNFAQFVHVAITSKDAEGLKKLTPRYPFADGGKIPTENRLSIRVLPYAPAAEVGDVPLDLE